MGTFRRNEWTVLPVMGPWARPWIDERPGHTCDLWRRMMRNMRRCFHAAPNEEDVPAHGSLIAHSF
jgi:hypothetical protein